MGSTEFRTLFVWRGPFVADRLVEPKGPRPFSEAELPGIYKGWDKCCPFCGSTYHQSNNNRPGRVYYCVSLFRCLFCGFHARSGLNFHLKKPYNSNEWIELATLESFDINDPLLGLDELGSHLRRKYSDINLLEGWRFEQLLADVFGNLGYSVILTPKTKDDGVDIFLLESSNGTKAIVECKRWSRGVGIAVIDRIAGVKLRKGVDRAIVVTNSYFTEPANRAAKEIRQASSGFSIDLIEGDQLFRMLDIYDIQLPPSEMVRLLIRR